MIKRQTDPLLKKKKQTSRSFWVLKFIFDMFHKKLIFAQLKGEKIILLQIVSRPPIKLGGCLV